MRARADEAGYYRYALPERMGGMDGSNLGMAIIREHLAHKGPGLYNVLQTEASVVGNHQFPQILDRFGTDEQQEMIEDVITGETRGCVRSHRTRPRIRCDLDGHDGRERRR